jgi:hypothetical protein
MIFKVGFQTETHFPFLAARAWASPGSGSVLAICIKNAIF